MRSLRVPPTHASVDGCGGYGHGSRTGNRQGSDVRPSKEVPSNLGQPMHRTRTAAALLAAAATLAFAPATAADHDPEQPAGYHLDANDPDSPFFVESQAWFTASGPTGIGNVDHEQGAWIGWSSEEPTSATGGVTAATGASGLRAITDDSEFEKGQFTAEGTVTGLIDSFVLDLTYLDNPAAPFCGMVLAVDLEIDDVPILDMDGHGGPVDVAVSDGAARLKVTDIHRKLQSYGTYAEQLIGDETTEHTVHLSVTQYPICTEVVWQYGTADAAASITFNHDPSLPDVSGHTEFSALNPPTA